MTSDAPGDAPAPDTPGTTATGLRRRPTGQAPPLPRHFDRPAVVWLTAAAVLAVAGVIIGLSPRLRATVVVLDGGIVERFADHRPSGSWLVDLHDVVADWLVPVVGWITLVVLVATRRLRHLVVWIASFLVVGISAALISDLVARPRPLGIEIAGSWVGPSLPSPAMTSAALLGVSACFALAPAGRTRRRAQLGVAVLLVVVGLVELAVGVAHPTDLAAGLLLGASIPLVAFRWFTPDEVFPVTYGGGNAAHLDVTGERGRAIRSAVEHQLGVRVLDVKPIGLEGSAGSTPLRLRVADPVTGDTRPALFAKLMARSHLRSDRWYKLGRTLLYGRLEDERRFTTVRRLVEREDYLGLRTEAAGVRVPRSLGVVEITPEREYLLVTEFLDGFRELGEAEPDQVDTAVVDGGLDLVRRLWDAGLAHRDVKPANVMVRPASDGEPAQVALIDVGFAQVRPSPWRQAVDLANMMLVLALPTDPETVYERALRRFSPDEVAEAFAATAGITVPTQLRTMIAADGRDLVGELRRLAPDRPRIPIQRWSIRRVLLLVGVAVAAVAAAALSLDVLRAVGMLP